MPDEILFRYIYYLYYIHTIKVLILLSTVSELSLDDEVEDSEIYTSLQAQVI
jgi:hypothetical protein